jgi:hypothetical protein
MRKQTLQQIQTQQPMQQLQQLLAAGTLKIVLFPYS